MIVRNLLPDEDWPSELGMGFAGPALDRKWCWAAINGEVVAGGLIGCPMHGALFLLRLSVFPSAPATTVRHLLRTALRDAEMSGLGGFITLTDPDTEVGQRLAYVAELAGATTLPSRLVLSFGLLEKPCHQCLQQ